MNRILPFQFLKPLILPIMFPHLEKSIQPNSIHSIAKVTQTRPFLERKGKYIVGDFGHCFIYVGGIYCISIYVYTASI